MEERRYYIYVLFDLKKYSNITLTEINQSFIFEPYYIGKGTKNRRFVHKNIKNTRHKKDAKTKSLLNSGFDFKEICKIVVNNLTETEAYELEKSLIEKISLDNLTNITPGGIGGFGSHRGETYEEIYGEERAKEIAGKISNSNKNKKATKEQREERSKNMKEKFKNEEFKENHIKNITGRKMPESFSKLMSKKLKNVSYKERYGEERAKEISLKKRNSSNIGQKQTTEMKNKMARGRAKYLWCVEENGICYINLYRYEFLEIFGKCPYRYKGAFTILKKKS